MKKCEVLELMELQLERREREQNRLRLDLDSAQQEMNSLKISRMQIEAEVRHQISFFLFFGNIHHFLLDFHRIDE